MCVCVCVCVCLFTSTGARRVLFYLSALYLKLLLVIQRPLSFASHLPFLCDFPRLFVQGESKINLDLRNLNLQHTKPNYSTHFITAKDGRLLKQYNGKGVLYSSTVNRVNVMDVRFIGILNLHVLCMFHARALTL